jgi:hypothetical protein
MQSPGPGLCIALQSPRAAGSRTPAPASWPSSNRTESSAGRCVPPPRPAPNSHIWTGYAESGPGSSDRGNRHKPAAHVGRASVDPARPRQAQPAGPPISYLPFRPSRSMYQTGTLDHLLVVHGTVLTRQALRQPTAPETARRSTRRSYLAIISEIDQYNCLILALFYTFDMDSAGRRCCCCRNVVCAARALHILSLTWAYLRSARATSPQGDWTVRRPSIRHMCATANPLCSFRSLRHPVGSARVHRRPEPTEARQVPPGHAHLHSCAGTHRREPP